MGRLPGVLAVLLLIAIAPALAAVTHSSSTTGTGGFTAAAGSTSFSHDSGSGSDRLLVVALLYDASSGHSVSSVTYGGMTMASAGTPATTSGRRLALFTLTNPSSGTNTIQITHSAGVGAVEWRAIATTYTGVDQTTPTRNYNSASGIDSTTPYEVNLVITSQSNDLVYTAAASREGGITWTPGAGQTERGDINGASTLSLTASDEAGAASTAMDFQANSVVTFAVAGISIIPSSGGAPPPTPVCGDGAVESGETCDNGASNGACPAACSSSCTTNTCSVPDTTPPTQVTGLTATATSSSQINLAWSAASDAVGVTGYRVYRGGTQIATTASTSYSNTGLTASTAYSYTIAAYDAAGNVGTQSSSASATTQASTPPPTGNGLLFESDWSAGTGTSTTAMRDGTRWEGGGSLAGVVTATSAGLTNWPTANAWMVSTTAGQNQITTQVLWKNNIGSAVTAGSHRYWRIYTQVLWPDTYGTTTYNGYEHGWEGVQPSGPVTGQQDFFSVQRIPRADGTWFIGYTNYLNGRRYVCSPLLNKAQTYRIELHQAFFATYYTVELRVYDHTNAMIINESDCYDYSITGQPDLGAVQFAFNPATQGNLPTALHMGTNGPGPTGAWSPTPYGNHNIYAHGAFCVRDDTWCGPYGGVVTPPADTTPPTATITAPTASQVLAAGTTSATLTVTTNEAATCRWSTTDIAYDSMTNTLASATTTSHTATLTGLANGSSHTRYVRCQDTATTPNTMTSSASVSFSVANPSMTTQGLLFESDWGTATGTDTVQAFGDGGAWDYPNGGSPTVASIDTAASLGLTNWPTANAYRVERTTHALRENLGAPTAGNHRYFRYYLQVLYDDTHGAATSGMLEHGVESVDAAIGGGDGFNPYRIPRNDGTWFPGYRDIYSGYRYVADQLNLSKNRTYRIEWHIAYGDNTYTVEYRIYDENGVLVADEDDFFEMLPQVSQDTLGSEIFSYVPEDHAYFSIGTNGPGSNFPLGGSATDDLFAHGAVCIRDDTWCGPHGTTPLPTYRDGDLNRDGAVNILDVTLIIQNFKRRSNYDTGADINNDGTVNIFDMVLLGRNWG